MSQRVSNRSHQFIQRLIVLLGFIGGLVLLAPWRQVSRTPTGTMVANQAMQATLHPEHPMPSLQGTQARDYLQQQGHYESLLQAVTAARFGLKHAETNPFDGSRNGGYLGMSHVQNLNVWFDDAGPTIRPTRTDSEQNKAWLLRMTLKSYGYGRQQLEAPPVISQRVKDNRIDYQRAACRWPVAGCQFEKVGAGELIDGTDRRTFHQRLMITEWYENTAAGIEQGFTIAAAPGRQTFTGKDEPLRLVIALAGDLQARLSKDDSNLELLDKGGDAALSYGKLIATDAQGHNLAAHIEANHDGSEIALAIDDRDATYPIQIDPITASLEQKLTKPTSAQAGTEFGDAVAISGDVAVIGAFLEDVGASVDQGVVYIFTRNGSTWTFKYSSTLSSSPGAQCGWSVAIDQIGFRVAFGCPGANSNSGFVELLRSLDNWSSVTGVAVNPSDPLDALKLGDRYGESVGLSHNWVFAGAPFGEAINDNTIPNVGNLYGFLVDSNLNVDEIGSYSGKFINNAEGRPAEADSHLGASLAVSANPLNPQVDVLIVGIPGSGSQAGAVQIFGAEAGARSFYLSAADFLKASDASPGDLFGYSVSTSGDKAVIGAPLNDNAKGTDAGAVYVFAGYIGHWTQQQKLIASDGIDRDQFGQSVAVEGNTIVVGSPYNGSKTFVGNRGNGRSYVFTWNLNTWSEQTIISALFDGAPVDKFGIAVALSRDAVISGAEHAEPGGTTNAGAAYIHRLSCVPPQSSGAWSGLYPTILLPSQSICPGSSIQIFLLTNNVTNAPLSYQWRRNGVNIAGATDSKYTITNATDLDQGNYDLIVANSCGAEISTPFRLDVLSFSVFPSTQNVGAAGNTGLLAVNATGSCPWIAQSNASWITVTSGASGTGSGNVGFRVDPNPSSTQRTGTMTVAGWTITFRQDAAPPPPNVVQFSSTNYSVQEDCTTVSITVNRSGDPSGAASVDYNTSDVTATERKDYIKALGTLRFAAGETSKSFAVLINEDSYVEGNETFNLTLSNPVGVTLGGPAIATVTIIDDPSEGSANPIDDPRNYVCQHYHDFLNRQPDASGWDFWTNQITACGSDASCIDARRVNVSASFFLSIEFQDTGYLVERIYKAAYGDATGNSTFPSAHQLAVPTVRLNEFLADTQEIGLGVIVGQGNWQQQIENNKQAFTAAFVQRSRFTTAFPSSMTAAQFVDTLNANAGNPLSAAERNQLVNDLSTNAKTRAQVLRAVAESQMLKDAESNRAFVLMQYFGYLRRNPNDPQDSDYTGYDFWLTKLNQFSGNYINAEMVKAFITSIEYRQRFGS